MNKSHRRMRILIAVFVPVLLLVGWTAAYLVHIQGMATALIASAREIRTTEDAEREIAAWKARAGNEFWVESDHPGGDHTYDAEVVNLSIARFRVVQPTGVTVGLTMRDGKLHNVAVIESTGWYPVASVWIQEWFDEELPNRIRVLGHRKPYDAVVEFPSSLPDQQREKAFAVNTKCLVLPSGCKNAGELLPGIWQLESGTGKTVGIGSNLTGSREFRPVDVQYGLRGTVNAEEIQQVIRASIDKLVSVAYTDGTTQKLFVHTVDDEGFVCDLVTELRQPPAYAFWVRFTDVLEVHPIQNASDNK